MRRFLVVLLVLALIAGGYWGYVTYVEPAMATQSGPTRTVAANGGSEALAPPVDDLENVIWASGKLVPLQWANLSPVQGGNLRSILVKEGDWVAPGDVLAELDASLANSQIEIASAAVAEARAAHDKLLAGATASEMAGAEAGLAAAQAQVAVAQGQLLQAETGITQAEAQLLIAQQQYNELASRPTPAERTAAAAQIDIAQVAVSQAQAAYNQVRGDPDIGLRPEALALQQATEGVKAAQAQYQVAIQGASPQQLAVAAAHITSAQSQVAVAQAQIPAGEAAVLSAQAGVASAQATLDRVKAGATSEDIAISEARMRSAVAALTSAHAQKRQVQIIAPFEGQVSAVNMRMGELAGPGQPILLLGDIRQMQVETTDLRETDVVRLQEGLEVEVTFDSLPDRIFTGTITHIAPVSNTDKGSTNYTLRITIPDLDENLRWGMTAFINIQTE
ncbi:MAG: efflux RND transporter periplasmic adaptor subunit [Caldilineaceae bacterium]|nr:efflux RND transporter periplasmic adaptor subunit [Caldilineaceae bacterium]HRJ43893.1 efflux RND transporter periplasmic adaptor subunit [Caldilineaceae bacterium]